MTADEDALRRALEAEAGRVDVAADALSVIRRRVAARRGWRRFLVPLRWPPGRFAPAFGLGAALTAAAAVSAVLVVLAGLLPTSPAPNPPAGSGIPVTASVDEALSTPPGSLAVYYLGATRNGPLLYREFHPGVSNGSSLAAKVTAGLTEVLSHPPLDPDYFSGWPEGTTVRAVTVDGATATVDLAGATINTVDAKKAAQAVQQLVWTVTAASATLTGVRLLFDGQRLSTLWGSGPGDGVLHRGNALEVRAPVWLIDPQQGAAVGRTFTVFVAGVVPEGAAWLRVRSGAAVVQEQPIKLDNGAPAQGTAKVSLTLDPGRYTIEAYFRSTVDGSEQFVDDHEFTVG
jgi:hypothetical protein